MDKIITETRQKMTELYERKGEMFAFLQREIDAAEQEKIEAEAAINQAFADMDSKALADGRAKLSKAEQYIKACEIRKQNLAAKEVIPEAESDAVIDALLEHEASLCEEYEAAIEPTLKKLRALTDDHKKRIKDTEDLIMDWTHKVHANYRSFVGSIYANGTNRSDFTQPVHHKPYTGSMTAGIVDTFFDNLERMKGHPQR